MTDKQQWDRLVSEHQLVASEFTNFLQTLSIDDLNNTETVKKLVAMRYGMVDALLHVFLFIEDANDLHFLKLTGGEK